MEGKTRVSSDRSGVGEVKILTICRHTTQDFPEFLEIDVGFTTGVRAPWGPF